MTADSSRKLSIFLSLQGQGLRIKFQVIDLNHFFQNRLPGPSFAWLEGNSLSTARLEQAMIKQIAAAIGSTLVVGAASAAVHTDTFGPTSNPYESTAINQTLTLDQFDSSLGNLLSAKLKVTVGGSLFYSASNVATSPGVQNGNVTGLIDITLTGGLLPPLPLALSPFSLVVGTDPLSLDEQNRFESGGWTQTEDSFEIDLTDLLGLTGVGTFDLTCVSSNNRFTSSNSNIVVTDLGDSEASCNASIDYTYDDQTTTIPEPGSLALLGAALAGLAATARRRRTV